MSAEGIKRKSELIDSHVHLDMPQFEGEVDEVLERAGKAGVVEVLNVSYDVESLERTINLTEHYESVYGACGIHPHDAIGFDDETERAIKRCILRKKLVAVGEIGLDYYRDLSPRKVQREVFRRQLGMALYFSKPVVIHSRESFEDTVRILDEEGVREVGGIFHAFGGGEEELKTVLSLGFLVGIGGPVTYKNSRLPDVLKKLPSDSFVLETDSPYLPPVPYRGKRNEPAYVTLVRDKLAEVLGVTPEDVERASFVNYMRVIRKKKDFPPAVAYNFRGALYLNVTNSCTNNCRFCPRTNGRFFFYGHNLNLLVEPGVDEVVSQAMEKLEDREVKEIVFCGYGEPTSRLPDILEIARSLKQTGIPIRLNTNGHGNIIHGRNIVPELEQVFDAVSVSVNFPDAEKYMEMCRPDFGADTYEQVLDFVKRCAESGMRTIVTAVDIPGVDIEALKKIVSGIEGVDFKLRRFYNFGGELD